MEKIKDFLYDHTDLLMGIIVFLGIGLIISQSFSVFDRGILAILRQESAIPIEEAWEDYQVDSEDEPNEDESPANEDDSTDSSEEDPSEEDQNDSSTDDPVEDENNSTDEILEETVTITIPDGSSAYRFGQLLEENNLIDSAMDFANETTSLGVETQLRPGIYEIPHNASLKEIIEIFIDRSL